MFMRKHKGRCTWRPGSLPSWQCPASWISQGEEAAQLCLKGQHSTCAPREGLWSNPLWISFKKQGKKKESIYFSCMLIAVLIWTINVSFWQETLVAPYLTRTFIATALRNKTYSLLFRLSCCTQLLGSQVSHLYCTTPGITYADASAVGVSLLPGLFLRWIRTVSGALPLSQRQAFLVR